MPGIVVAAVIVLVSWVLQSKIAILADLSYGRNDQITMFDFPFIAQSKLGLVVKTGSCVCQRKDTALILAGLSWLRMFWTSNTWRVRFQCRLHCRNIRVIPFAINVMGTGVVNVRVEMNLTEFVAGE